MFGFWDFGGFSIFGILFSITFFLILGVIIFNIFRGIRTWNKNNASPRLTVGATLVSRRTHVSHHGNTAGDHTMGSSSSTSYYLTFQVESGDRMEFRVSGQEYGMLVEGDFGKLSFQGTRYLGFERQ